MHNIPYLHNQKDKKDLIRLYYIGLIPFLIFGFYKNGLLLYQADLISYSSMFLPLYFYGISVLIGYLLAKILHENPLETIFFLLVISATISLNTNMLLYPIILFVGYFIGKYLFKKTKLSFHYLSFTRLILLLGLFVQAYSYLNIAEKLQQFNYNLFDIFVGHTIGGIASTSLLLCLLVFLLFSRNRFFKKPIFILASFAYILIYSLIAVLTKQYSILSNLLNGNSYFIFLFLGTSFDLTPHDKKGMAFYGLLIGLLTAILSFKVPYEAPFISIFIISFLIPLINRKTAKIALKSIS